MKRCLYCRTRLTRRKFLVYEFFNPRRRRLIPIGRRKHG